MKPAIEKNMEDCLSIFVSITWKYIIYETCYREEYEGLFIYICIHYKQIYNILNLL